MTEVLYGFDAGERRRVAELLAQERFFWLDVSLRDTSRDALVEALAVPEQALRALSAAADGYTSRTFHADAQSVVFPLHCHIESDTPVGDGAYRWRPLKVVALISGDYLLTVHDERVSLPAALDPDLPDDRSKAYAVYAVLDAMIASSFDALNEVELKLDAVAASWTGGTGGTMSRGTLRESGSRLATMRRWAGGEQAVFERVGVEIAALRSFGASVEAYFDSLEEQVGRLVTSIDAAANGMGMLLDLQLNERAYVVSVVATIFVPLTFITGFFGMNFGWMVDRVDTPVAFWLLGFAVPVATGVASWRFLVRRFLVGDAPATKPG